MTERLSADDLRAALSGKAKPFSPLDYPNPLDMPDGSSPDFDTEPLSTSERDLVKDTLARYAAPIPLTPAGRPNFRKVVDEVPAPKVSSKRSNKYAASCITCGGRVEAEQGYLAKDGAKWAAEHQAGQCISSTESVPEPVEVPAGFVKITAITGQTYVGLQPGVYTLPNTQDGHRTFRVRVQSTEDAFAPGKTILEYLSGPDNGKDYTGFGFLNGTRLAVWKKHQENQPLLTDAQAFLADPSKAMLAATCIRCNALLSTPDSIAALMGPACRERGW